MKFFKVEILEEYSRDMFVKSGLSVPHAETVTQALVFANLRGVDTHGVARIPSYLERLRLGLVNASPNVSVRANMPAVAVVDGDNGMGPVVGAAAMDAAIACADKVGVGVSTAKRSNHFGAASFFALQAVKHDCIGVCLSAASKSLAPYGSMQPLFGTNPVAVAAPAGKFAPWSMDMAASVAARGHIRLAATNGQSIPTGWALDAEGRPTTDARKALAGVMLPFAGVKGSAIAMMVDILGGVLSGSAFGGEIRDMTKDFSAPQDVGHFFLALKIAAFMPVRQFHERMEEEISRLRSLTPAEGFSEILYPGEPEARKAAVRREEGVPLSSKVLAELVKAGDGLGVSNKLLLAA